LIVEIPRTEILTIKKSSNEGSDAAHCERQAEQQKHTNLLWFPLTCTIITRHWYREPKGCFARRVLSCRNSTQKAVTLGGNLQFECYWVQFDENHHLNAIPLLRQTQADYLSGLVTLPYASMYESDEYKVHFDRLMRLADQGYNNDVGSEGDWAKDWATNLATEAEAQNLDASRKKCLALLFCMYDTWHLDPLAPRRLREAFRSQWVSNILEVCLPMDRANALYNMQIIRGPNQPRGIHWISEEQASKNDFKTVLEGYHGFHSMSRRYEWIIDAFNLGNTGNIKRWTTPVFIQELLMNENARRHAQRMQSQGLCEVIRCIS
jgi:hypothetical protein